MDPAKVPDSAGGSKMQQHVNDYANASAMKIKAGFVTKLREQLMIPSPDDRLKVDEHGYIYFGRTMAL